MIEVIVKGGAGLGKSHVLAVIERALNEAYGETIKIECDDTESERRSIGEDIREWQQPIVEKIVLTEEVTSRDYFREWTGGGTRIFDDPDGGWSAVCEPGIAASLRGYVPIEMPDPDPLGGQIIKCDETASLISRASIAHLAANCTALLVEPFMPGDGSQMIGMTFVTNPTLAMAYANKAIGMTFDMGFVEPYMGGQEKITTFRDVTVRSAMMLERHGKEIASVQFAVGKMFIRLRQKSDNSPAQLGIPLSRFDEEHV